MHLVNHLLFDELNIQKHEQLHNPTNHAFNRIVNLPLKRRCSGAWSQVIVINTESKYLVRN